MMSMILLSLQFILNWNWNWLDIELQTSIGMISWKSIHGWIAIYSILFRTNAIFSNADIIKRVVHFIKPAKEQCDT